MPLTKLAVPSRWDRDVRLQAWSRLAHDLDLNKLASTTRVIGLAEVHLQRGRAALLPRRRSRTRS